MVRENPQYSLEKVSFLRKAVISSASVTRQRNTIHAITEVDVTIPRNLIKKYQSMTERKLSFTGYITACFSQTVLKHPGLNSFITGNKLVKLKAHTISVLVERVIDQETVPEPLVIEECERLTCLEITNIIREAQNRRDDSFGSLSQARWFTFIPGFLLKLFVRMADRNIQMGVKYGKLAVTAMGMFSQEPVWFVPHGSPTVLLTIGSIVHRIVENEGRFENREHLCLTVSFDHDLVDGAPAARFMNDLIGEIKSGNEITRLFS